MESRMAYSISISRKMEAKNHSDKVLESLNKQRNQNELCDFTLEADEGFKLCVHRAVMVVCSDYFRAMMTGDMLESKSGHCHLQGVPAQGLDAIVEFAYTGKLHLTLDNIADVLSAASHLQVLEAMHLCSQYMVSTLSVTNCALYYNLSEVYSLSACYQKFRNFMLKEFNKISDTEHFYSLSASQLVSLLGDNEIFMPNQWTRHGKHDKSTEYQLFEKAMQWIDFDEKEREQYVGSLMKQVRFSSLDKEELEEKVSPLALMQQNHECRELLSEAVDYRNDALNWPLLQTPRTQVRISYPSLAFITPDSIQYSNLKSGEPGSLCMLPGVEPHAPCVSVIENFMYLCGGCADAEEKKVQDWCFRYDPRTSLWCQLMSMNEARKDFGLVAKESKLYAIAGKGKRKAKCTVECYSISDNKWEQRQSLRYSVYGHAVALLHGKIYVSGGRRLLENKNPRERVFRYCGNNDVQSYCTESDTWTTEQSLRKPRYLHCMVSVADKLYVLGGTNGNLNVPRFISSVECFSPGDQTWTLCKAKLEIIEAGSVVVDKCVYILGGINTEPFGPLHIRKFDPEEDIVDSVNSVHFEFYGKSCCVITMPPESVHAPQSSDSEPESESEPDSPSSSPPPKQWLKCLI